MDTSGRATTVFVRQVHRALRNLYNPAELGKSPLAGGLATDRRHGSSAAALREALTEAIESLKPDIDVPPQANAWRFYHILSQRYAEQFTQQEVATNLALSTRQLGRLEKEAIRVLADCVQSRLTIEPAATEEEIGQGIKFVAPSSAVGTPSREQELQWLRASCPSEKADVAELIGSALRIASPLAIELGIHVQTTVPEGLPPVAVHVTTMRQALIHVITSVMRSVPGGSVTIQVETRLPQVWVRVRPTPRRGCPPRGGAGSDGEALEVARELLRLSDAFVEALPTKRRGEAVPLRLVVPVLEQVGVLVVDDNTDTLQLLERYLAGSHYRFHGTSDPQQVIALAESVSPRIIVLDVMLPGIDGWELLDRLREHPQLCHVPVLVCTILPEEDLARTLGAAALVRKPVTQVEFLASLHRALDRQPTGSE